MTDRIIQEPSREDAYNENQAALEAAQCTLNRRTFRNTRAIGAQDRELMAGDPASESGVKVAESELDDDLQAKVNAGRQLVEVTPTSPSTPAPGTPFNVQDGTYAGGGPATVIGDTPALQAPGQPVMRLPSSGLDFEDDGRIEVTLNGQEMQRGRGLGFAAAQWVSSVQIALDRTIYPGNQVTVRGPIVPPSPSPV
jgi:hypothetical protein